jgi:hypothetical protein
MARTGTYTAAQSKALESMKQPGLVLGAVRAEYVNHALDKDGTLLSDIGLVKAAAKAAVAARRAELMAALDAFNADTDPDETDTSHANKVSEATKALDAAVLRHREIDAHVAEGRFLFVLDDDGAPSVYFQCAVLGNPDTDYHDPASPEFESLTDEAKAAVLANREADLAAWEAAKTAMVDEYMSGPSTPERALYAAVKLVGLQVDRSEVAKLLDIEFPGA